MKEIYEKLKELSDRTFLDDPSLLDEEEEKNRALSEDYYDEEECKKYIVNFQFMQDTYSPSKIEINGREIDSWKFKAENVIIPVGTIIEYVSSNRDCRVYKVVAIPKVHGCSCGDLLLSSYGSYLFKCVEPYEEVNETIDKKMSREEIVKEIMDSWEKKGEINNDPIESKEEALKKAIAISYSVKGED